MKKLILILAVLLPLSALAQGTEAKIKRIKQMYSEAQAKASFKQSDEWMEKACYTLDFKSRVNYAGGGPVEHSIEVFLVLAPDGDNPDSKRFNTFEPSFVRDTRQGSMKVYGEMLFDPDSGDLLFSYQRMAQADGTQKEQRYYYDRGRLVKAVPEGKPYYMFMTSDIALEHARAIKSMVNGFNVVDN